MIPLGDASRRTINFPVVTVFITTTNTLVFPLELMLGDSLVNRWSPVPADIMAGRNRITILTAIFMHAG